MAKGLCFQRNHSRQNKVFSLSINRILRSISKPKELADIAPGTNPPFILFDGEVFTDVPKIEDYLESTLSPPE